MFYNYFAKGNDIYSSENSIDMDDESRYNAIRVNVSRILSDAGNCMVLTDLINDKTRQDKALYSLSPQIWQHEE